MSLVQWLLGGGPVQTAVPVRSPRSISASHYDATRTTRHNEKRWIHASDLNAIEVLTPEQRRTARIRARYEIRNNSWLAGIVRTKANDTVGTGPRLQMQLDDREANQRIERAWATWARSIRLPLKLRTALMAKIVDGEVFATPVTNRRVQGAVLLDLRLIQAARVTSGMRPRESDREIDGIVFDESWNPVRYRVTDLQPNETPYADQYQTMDAARVYHWFRPEHVEQIRGISELAPCIELFACLRAFRDATLAAAETAADYAGVVYTDQPPGQQAEMFDPFDAVELEARSLLSLPAGWRMEQMEAKHPSVGHKEFVELLLNEAARSALIPFNVAYGNSSSYNYASGRLDFQTYRRELDIERDDCAGSILDPLLREFLREAASDPDIRVPASLRDAIAVPHKWFWPAMPHVDPVKEAQAAQIRLQCRMTTLAQEYAEAGLDWLEEIAQTADEEAELRRLGLERFATPNPNPAPTTNTDEEATDAADR